MSEIEKLAGKPPAGLALPIGALSLAIMMWGATPVASRYLVGSDAPLIEPGPLVAFRFALSALILLPLFIRARPFEWSVGDLGFAAVIAGCGVVGYNLPVTFGQVSVPAGTTALIIATEPVWILLLWALRDRRRPTLGAVSGAGIGLIGILILVGANLGHIGREALGGIALVMTGAFFWSLYCVLAAGFIKRKGVLNVTATTVVIGCIPLLLLFGQQVPDAVSALGTDGFLAILLLALGSTVIATLFWNYGVGMLPGPQSGAFLHGIPVIGILAGNLFLSEQVSITIVIAAILVISGVVVAQMTERGQAASLDTGIDAYIAPSSGGLDVRPRGWPGSDKELQKAGPAS